FVSYYDYYQPEAYIPSSDTYIEKDAQINEEIDKLRHSATCAVMERKDVVVVSSVSCIYNLGNPAEYRDMVISLRPGMAMPRKTLLRRLVEIQYERNDVSFTRNHFRVRGDVVDIFPANNTDTGIRVEFFGDEIDSIQEIYALTGVVKAGLNHAVIYPASHYVTSPEKREEALMQIHLELEKQVAFFNSQGKLIEAQRLSERVKYDMEMIREIGYCSGIENYSRIFAGLAPGSTPFCLLDFFPKDYLLIVDESHVTLPQVRGMSSGDYARKKNLVDYGFRLPSAFDNRPLNFDEFTSKVNQVIYVSATPGEYELERSDRVAEQLIRPTGLLDPLVEVRPIEGQIDDIISEINLRADKNERSLVITLTKQMAEDLTEFLTQRDMRVRYMHHAVETLERTELLRDLRKGKYDVLVGINLLREGLDLPEVSLVAILDADKEGFLRSERSLIQIIGRAARHAQGKVLLYGDTITESMKKAIEETARRREIQSAYNQTHGIVPKTIVKPIAEQETISQKPDDSKKRMNKNEREKTIAQLTADMKKAAGLLDFEYAAVLRDKIKKLEQK
ncbi:MAG TPA: excinuclease ABC subunit B, partial [Clostridiales bacterium]|nr:excinuclease ABC subunit B [Clostridiales bacterium]